MQTATGRRTDGRRLLGLMAVLGLLSSAAIMAAAQAMASVAPVAVEAGSAGIVPGQSIDGVKLGDTAAQVEQLLGASTTMPVPNKSVLYYDPPLPFDGNISLDAQGHVNGMNTNSSRFKTSKGIHVGSSLSAVHRAYPQAKKGSTPLGPDYTLKSSDNGQPVYTFFYTEPQKYGGHGVAQIEIDLQSALGEANYPAVTQGPRRRGLPLRR